MRRFDLAKKYLEEIENNFSDYLRRDDINRKVSASLVTSRGETILKIKVGRNVNQINLLDYTMAF